MIIKWLTLGLIPLLFSCQHKEEIDTMAINFTDVDWYAQHAAMAYKSEVEILEASPDTVLGQSRR